MRIPVMIVTRAAFVNEGVCQPIIPREPFRQFEKEHFPTGNVATREIFLPLGGIFLLLISLTNQAVILSLSITRECHNIKSPFLEKSLRILSLLFPTMTLSNH